MGRPPYLKQGDKVAIVSTARKITMSDITHGVEILQSWGLKVIFSENLLEDYNQFAGNDEIRAKNLQEAINNKEIKAIFCSKGGYGTVRIIDKIDFSQLINNPKWIIGFSDITVLHCKLNNMNIESLHTHLLTTMITATPDSLNAMHKALFGANSITEDNIQSSKQYYSYNNLTDNNKVENRSGTAIGILVGGNLSVLYSLMGSNCEIDTTNKILFIEDLDEYLYHIDRMIICLKRAGKLSNLKGLIVGSMNNMHDNTVPFGKTAEEIIMDAVKDYDYPVCFYMPFGHIDNNMPLILGSKIELLINGNDVNLHFINSENKEDKKAVIKKLLKSSLWLLIFFFIIWLFYFILRHLLK